MKKPKQTKKELERLADIAQALFIGNGHRITYEASSAHTWAVAAFTHAEDFMAVRRAIIEGETVPYRKPTTMAVSENAPAKVNPNRFAPEMPEDDLPSFDFGKLSEET